MDIKDSVGETSVKEAGKKGISNKVRITNLVIGDILVFLIFAVIGRRSHGMAAGLDSVLLIIQTAAPFIIGWFLVAPFLGVFRHGLDTQPRSMAIRTILAWIVACPVGLAIRGIFIERAVPPMSFAIVTLLVIMLLLLVWRLPLAWLGNIRQREQK